MPSVHRPGRRIATVGGLGLVLLAAPLIALTPLSVSRAGWPWKASAHHASCGHPTCAPDQCLAPAGWAGEWYWMRSPDQEQRVVMGLYNRYCIRCHGIDGRGVWDIPDVPDFTDPRWQASRPDPQIVNILMEGRGAVMPTFRGTLTLEETCAMARYLRTFVPGTEISPRGRPRRPARRHSGRAATPTPLRTASRPVTPAR